MFVRALRSTLAHISDRCTVSVYYWSNTPLKSRGLCVPLGTFLLWECEHAETPSLISPKISAGGGVVSHDSSYVLSQSADTRALTVPHRPGSVCAEWQTGSLHALPVLCVQHPGKLRRACLRLSFQKCATWENIDRVFYSASADLQ